jgi:diguanylate cyclase (GGDEF)-like protein/PAS domain S-box-containing protein
MNPEQLEKKLEETEKKLKESESRFGAISSLTTDAIIMTDTEQRIRFFNKGAELTFGYTAEEVKGKPLSILIPEKYTDRHHLHVKEFQAMAVQSRLMGERKMNIFGRHKNGTEFPAEVSISKWKNDGETIFTAVLQNISDQLQTEEVMNRLAYFDSLSGLPSRFQFAEKLNAQLRISSKKKEIFSVLLLDLIRFKEINHSLGTACGDLLIKSVSQRIMETLGPNDFLARLGPDEFGILMISPPDQGRLLAAKICEALRKPFLIDHFPLAVEASIGISLYPDHGVTTENLMQKAEIALVESKRVGTDISIYDSRKDPFISSTRLALLGELFNAIESRQLFLLYQPKIDLQTGSVIGVESLVRWKHPIRGMILPSEFISPAENTDLIKTLTLFVIRESLKQFQALFNLGKKLTLAVNISNRNLNDPILPGQIVKMLIESRISPESLELEVTENAIMEHSDHALNAIQLIKRTGINLAIDEFGIGYSSLNILKKLPVGSVKIPRPFIKDLARNMEDLKIVESIINLAHTLGLKACAVGVEDKLTFQKLAALGCDSAQGNFMSVPITMKEVLGLIYNPSKKWL